MGHDRAVSCLVASPDARHFASSSYDNTIILWDTSQGTIIHELWLDSPGRDHGTKYPLALSPDGRYLLSGRDDGSLKVWDILGTAAEQVRVLQATRGMVIDACTWSADGMWIACAARSGLGIQARGTVHLWDAHTFRQLRVFEEFVVDSHLFFSPDSKSLIWPSYTPSGDTTEYTTCVWDVAGLVPDEPPRRFPLRPDDGRPHALSFDLAGKNVVTARHRRLHVQDLATGALLAVMEGHTQRISASTFSPDGRYILSASDDGTTKVWLAESGECAFSLEGHREAVRQARFSPDGNCIATASLDRTVRLWMSGDGSCLATFADHEAPVGHIVFSPDGKTLASGDSEGVVHIHDISHLTVRHKPAV